MGLSSFVMLGFSLLMGLLKEAHFLNCSDPTDGFTAATLTDWNFELQKPYDKPLDQRYSYENGVRRLWVYVDDKPHNPTSMTKARTEIRIRLSLSLSLSLSHFFVFFMFLPVWQGLDYSSGVWQFEGYGYVPNGTSGVSIVQIHGAAKGATTLQLRVYNGDLKYYRFDLVATDVYDKWIRYNVIHNVDAGKVTVFLDGVQRFEVKDQGPGDLYFKCGVYAQNNASYYMESRWKDIKIYKKY